MTGWAQVHGWRGRTSLRKRVQYDLDYIQRWSIGLDLRVLLMTIQHVVWGKTSWTESTRKPKISRVSGPRSCLEYRRVTARVLGCHPHLQRPCAARALPGERRAAPAIECAVPRLK